MHHNLIFESPVTKDFFTKMKGNNPHLLQRWPKTNFSSPCPLLLLITCHIVPFVGRTHTQNVATPDFYIITSSKAFSPSLSSTTTSSTSWTHSGNVWSQTYISGPEATHIQGEFIHSFSMFLHKHKVQAQFPFPRSVLYKLITPAVTGDRKACIMQSRRPLFHEISGTNNSHQC